MSSRFFHASDSSGSDSDSSSSSASSTEQKEVRVKKVTRKIVDDSESEDENRVVKSEKDKRFDEMRELIKKSKNTRKNNDLNAAMNHFIDLTKAIAKSDKVVKQTGIPCFIVKELVDVEAYTAEKWSDKEFRKKLSKDKSRSLTTLRQRIKKYFVEASKVAIEVEDYKKSPEEYLKSHGNVAEEEEEEKEEKSDSEAGEDSMSSSDDEAPVKAPVKAPKASKSGDAGDWGSDESDEWSEEDSDGSSDSGSSTDDDRYDGAEGEFARYTIEYFLKRADGGNKKKATREKKEKKERKNKEDKPDDEGWERTQTKTPGLSIGKDGEVIIFAKDVDINAKNVVQKLAEIQAQRPRKDTDRSNKVKFLEELVRLVIKTELGPCLELKVRMSIVFALYDYNSKNKDYMADQEFADAIAQTRTIVNRLNEEEKMNMSEKIQDDEETLTKEPNEEGKWLLRGSLVNTCTKLDTEFFKLLQNSDQHSEEYRSRLRHNQDIIELFRQGVIWALKGEDRQQICQMYLLVVKYMYYRHKSQTPDMVNPEQTIRDYCKYIYANDETQRIRTQAILYNIYHLALHDNWFQARDLMLMSHLQESIHNADIGTQIIYNRTMVQLGLCAFRKGLMEDAHQALTDIQSGNRSRELLAQGFSITRERTQYQERTERRRMQPYHTHINTELLECVYLVSAMFLEIPYMAEKEFDHRRRMISKQFHYQLRNSEKQAFVGPPDNMREHVLAAAKALKVGDWQKCIKFLINPKMNQKVWNLFAETEKVQSMLICNAKKESLRVYLFSYSQFYDNISLQWIQDNFELDGDLVHSEVSKMIINEELKASWDEPTNSLVLHQTEPTRLQNLALQLSQRLNNLTENNERLCESKQGSNFSAFYSSKSNNHKGKNSGTTNKPRTGGNQHHGGQSHSNWNRGGGGGRRF